MADPLDNQIESLKKSTQEVKAEVRNVTKGLNNASESLDTIEGDITVLKDNTLSHNEKYDKNEKDKEKDRKRKEQTAKREAADKKKETDNSKKILDTLEDIKEILEEDKDKDKDKKDGGGGGGLVNAIKDAVTGRVLSGGKSTPKSGGKSTPKSGGKSTPKSGGKPTSKGGNALKNSLDDIPKATKPSSFVNKLKNIKPGAAVKNFATGAAGLGIGVLGSITIDAAGQKVGDTLVDSRVNEFNKLRSQEDKDKYIKNLTSRLEKEKKYQESPLHKLEKVTKLGGETQSEILSGQLERILERIQPQAVVQPQTLQTGGHVNVPGSGTGDKVPFLLPPGSFVLNKMASQHYQNGGLVPTLLEPGEKVFGPGSWGPEIEMMNSMIPRFQKGGEVSQSEAGSARGGTVPTPKPTKEGASTMAQASEASKGKTNSQAILAAAEKSTGLMKGIGEQCANSTREVLKAAGHEAAGKTTKKGDLDPEGLAYNAPSYAASFAGSDMGTVKKSLSQVSAGDIILWKDTYGSYAKGAITHVGIAGEGNTQYDHGRATGWRKRDRSSLASNFAYGITLGGTATGGGDVGSGSGGGTAQPSGIAGIISSLGGSGLGEAASGLASVLSGFQGAIKSLVGTYGSAEEADAAYKALELSLPGGMNSVTQPPASATGGQGGDSKDSSTADTSLTPNRRAFLDTIAKAEGTSKYPDSGYKTMFTGKQFTAPPWEHPRQIQRSGGYASDAAGRYQFLSTTWDGHKLPDFSPKNQDKAALKEAEQKGAMGDIDNGNWSSAFTKVKKVWASMPGAGYGQPEKNMNTLTAFATAKSKSYEGGQTPQQAQTGGVIYKMAKGGNTSGQYNGTFMRFMNNMEKFVSNDQTAPIIINNTQSAPMPNMTPAPTTGHTVPTLPEGPSSIQSAEYFYRLSLGSVF